MISFSVYNLCYTTKEEYFSFHILKNETIIGEFKIVVSNKEKSIILSFFEIFKDFRGNGYSKEALSKLNETIELISKDYGYDLFYLEVNPFNDSSLSFNKTVSLYQKYLSLNFASYDENRSFLYKKIL